MTMQEVLDLIQMIFDTIRMYLNLLFGKNEETDDKSE